MNASRPEVGSSKRALRRSRLGLAARFPALALAAALSGCVADTARAPARQAYRSTGDPLADAAAMLDAAPPQDRGLYEYRLAAAAMRAGRFDLAEAGLDDALGRLSGIVGSPDPSAQRARSMFAAESIKGFVGEPYERSMAWYYRGLLYWRAGEIDNARASFRSAQFADSDAAGEGHRGDYVLLDYLDGLASSRIGGDGGDAFARAAARAGRELPPYDPDANVLLFVEFGAGPRKVASGRHGEKLQFRQGNTRARSAAVTIGGRTIPFEPWDDLFHQATTRGDRVMDHILGNKAVFKEGADALGDVALVGARIAAENIYKPRPPPPAEPKGQPDAGDSKPDATGAGETAEDRKKERPPDKKPGKPEFVKDRNAEIAAWTLGAIGVISKIAAAATIPRADTRTWDNLPQYLSFGATRLPPGEHVATVEFFDASGQRLDGLTRQQTISVAAAPGDTVVLLSEPKR